MKQDKACTEWLQRAHLQVMAELALGNIAVYEWVDDIGYCRRNQFLGQKCIIEARKGGRKPEAYAHHLVEQGTQFYEDRVPSPKLVRTLQRAHLVALMLLFFNTLDARGIRSTT